MRECTLSKLPVSCIPIRFKWDFMGVLLLMKTVAKMRPHFITNKKITIHKESLF